MKKTALNDAHIERKAKMAEFAGYEMPLYYEEGTIAEHEWVREKAGLFDVSHMGQIIIEGKDAGAFLNKVTPSEPSKLKKGEACYTVLTNAGGAIIDDLIVTRLDKGKFMLVLNASRKNDDITWLEQHLAEGLVLTPQNDKSLLALQGPEAAKVLFSIYGIDLDYLAYMSGQEIGLGDIPAYISRTGYTGEDGFEISVPASKTLEVWNKLLGHEDVKTAGLAARDTLRLEMGYPLYGQDIDLTVTPLEASLSWILAKEPDKKYIGFDAIRTRRDDTGIEKKRVGIILEEKGIPRPDMSVLDENGENEIGSITSGGFSPTLQKGIAQAYVKTDNAKNDAEVLIDVRGKHMKAKITKMPFVESNVEK